MKKTPVIKWGLIVLLFTVTLMNFDIILAVLVKVETRFDNSVKNKSNRDTLKIFFETGFDNNAVIYIDDKMVAKTHLRIEESSGCTNFSISCVFNKKEQKHLLVILDSYKRLDILIDCKYDYLLIDNIKPLKWQLWYSNELLAKE
ncbi:MAG: hypothetical protein CFE24_03325 [Flavobacterium sp. BFFFF2]|nr:MAG: hypothetical protein CFE24_03325 [Flavobacterium sp. BFFFF2]